MRPALIRSDRDPLASGSKRILLGSVRPRTLSAAGGRTAEDTVRLLSSSRMWLSSTLLFANEMFPESPDLVADQRTEVLFPWWEYERLLEKVREAEGPGNELNQAWTHGDVDLLRRVHQAGGIVIAGTDVPLDDPGIGIHQNLRAVVKYGFAPVDALKTASTNAARCCWRGRRMIEMTEPIKTGRLVLRPFTTGDEEDMFAFESRSEVARYLFNEPRTREDNAQELATRVSQTALRKEGDVLMLAIALEGTAIGYARLSWLSEQNKQGEFGYVLHPDHHGSGYASEASVEMLRRGFEQLGLHRIIGRCDPRATPVPPG